MSYPRTCCLTVPGSIHMPSCPEARGLALTALAPALYDAVRSEMARAATKHGWSQTPASGQLSDSECLVILVEEVGEVARAMTYDEGDTEALDKELVQVATMALAWANGRRVRRETLLRAERYEVRSDESDVPIRVMNGLGETVQGNEYRTEEAPAVKVFDKLTSDTGEMQTVKLCSRFEEVGHNIGCKCDG